MSECDFILKTAEGAQLKYTVTKGEKAVGVNDTVLTVEGGTADDSGTAKFAFNLADGESITYAGAYTGTVIFTVSVEEDVLTRDQDGVYRIRGAKSLAAFRDLVNSGLNHINAMLMNDIDLKGSETNQWTPIGNEDNQFKGNFDGGGHTISGLYINSTSDYQGLFGYVGRGGTVQNLGVDGTVNGIYYVGGVVGRNDGTITNCYNTGDVSGGSEGLFAGGVVGDNSNGTVTNCRNTGTVSGSCYVGGVVGFNYNGTVTNCYNTGDVSGDGYVGGVVGTNYGTVTNCCNTGDVSGSIYVGGVVGENDGGLTNCYNTGTVSGSDYVGGVAGRSYSTVTNCYYLTGTANGGIGGTEDSGGESTDKEGSAEAKTAAEFATQSTFVGWDFEAIWQMSDTLKRPTLRSNPENAS